MGTRATRAHAFFVIRAHVLAAPLAVAAMKLAGSGAVPEHVFSSRELTSLNLSGFDSAPARFAELTALEHLYVPSDLLAAVLAQPPRTLRLLLVKNGSVRTLPSLRAFTELQMLMVARDDDLIVTLPEDLGQLRHLTELILECKVTHVPPEVAQLPLRNFVFQAHADLTLAPEFLQMPLDADALERVQQHFAAKG